LNGDRRKIIAAFCRPWTMTKDEILKRTAAGEIDLDTAAKLFAPMNPTPEEVELFKKVERYRLATEEQERERWRSTRDLLERVASGAVTVDEALRAMKSASFLRKFLLEFSNFLLFRVRVYPLARWKEYCNDPCGTIEYRMAMEENPRPSMQCGVRRAFRTSAPLRSAIIGKNAHCDIDSTDGFVSDDHPLSIRMGAECSMKLPGVFGAKEYELYCHSVVKFMPGVWHRPTDDDLAGSWKEGRD
jgi:hypothetical protein